jgi:hypothetical protein
MTPARFLFLPLALISLVASAAPTARNVFIITIDGLRWQEIFTGADTAMMNRDDGGVNDNAVVGLREEFGGDTASARREKLMPFFWQTIAARGQVFGNRALNSTVQVANAEKISYPGYSELLTGARESAHHVEYAHPKSRGNGAGMDPRSAGFFRSRGSLR